MTASIQDHRVPLRPMTADEVFSIILALYSADAEFEPELAELTPQTAIAQCPWSCEGVGWRTITREFNDLFHVAIPEGEWRSAMLPRASRTLADVCQLIARYASVPVIEPVTIMGATSISAGAFLALRTAMSHCGIDVTEVRPSSEVEPYLTRHSRHMFRELARLAPDRLPMFRWSFPISGAIFLASFCCLGIGLIDQWLNLTSHAWLTLVSAGVLMLIGFVGCTLSSPTVCVPCARTFRDLSRIIAGEMPGGGAGFPVMTTTSEESS